MNGVGVDGRDGIVKCIGVIPRMDVGPHCEYAEEVVKIATCKSAAVCYY